MILGGGASQNIPERYYFARTLLKQLLNITHVSYHVIISQRAIPSATLSYNQKD